MRKNLPFGTISKEKIKTYNSANDCFCISGEITISSHQPQPQSPL